MHRWSFLASSAIGAISNAIAPIGALILLDVNDFGAFSLCYLIFAWAWSIELSAICDTWARQRAVRSEANPWPLYSTALLHLALLGAAAAAIAGMIVFSSTGSAAFVAIATGATLYRLGARFHRAAARGPRDVLVSDATGVGTFFVTLSIAITGFAVPPLDALLVSWALASLTSSIFLPPSVAHPWSALSVWSRRNASTIRPLLAESLLMDAGAIGTPLLLAPFLGLSNFGIYRSVSSISLPVQLILDPIRPNLSQTPANVLLGRKSTTAAFAGAALLGAITFAVLAWLTPMFVTFSAVLQALAEFAVPCAIFVAAAFLGYFYYIAARAHVRHGWLLTGRAIQTALAIGLPLLGMLLQDLPGAIWGFVAASTATPAIWAALLTRERMQG